MARSVVFRGAARCPQCQIAPRWCICAAARTVALPFALDILMHNGEARKPTSTGNLIRRVVPASRRIIYHNQRPPRREDVCMENRTTWILHPRGDPLDEVLALARKSPPASPAVPAPSVDFANLQVILIDGTWAQSTDMLRHVDRWGQKISLPATAFPSGSRYWLRLQHHPGHFSTIEALMALLKLIGLPGEHDALRLQFELHVYACLLARGQKKEAAEFLVESPFEYHCQPNTGCADSEKLPACIDSFTPQTGSLAPDFLNSARARNL